MLKIENLSAGILSNINLTIRRGRCTSINGVSGSGKTTLLNCIAGYQPYQGEIEFAGTSLDNLPVWRRSCRYLNQRLYLFPYLTVEHNLWLAQYANGQKRDKNRELEILTQMGIPHLAKRYPHQISGGEQQRVALARAMISSPALLLLDEPFSSLDWATREQLWMQINQLKNTGVTIVLVTHEPKEAQALADDHFILSSGKISLSPDFKTA